MTLKHIRTKHHLIKGQGLRHGHPGKSWERQGLPRELKWNVKRKLMDKRSILDGYMEYDKFKGYLVQFPDDVDWIPSLRSKDIQILGKLFFSPFLGKKTS